MIRFVQRNKDGKLVGHYANLQPGYAEEEVAGEHPDIVAWNAAREAAQEARRLAAAKRETDIDAVLAENAALKAALIKAGVVTAEAIEAEKK